MSGDLKDPQRSIPTGTLAAIGVGYIIYMVIPVFLNQWADPETLVADPLVMRRIAWWGNAILLGVWGATLSSAIGSILGAPRVLQALARDGILPHWLRWLGRGHGPMDEPRNGTLFTLGIALAAVSLGDLNLIAPVLTMFFLTTYLVLNVSAGLETFLQSPSFRPTFKVHWSLSLLGAVGCLVVMFLINAVATVLAAVIVLGIFLWLQRREMRGAWGDVRNGLWMTLVRTGLFQMQTTPDAKNWRPHLLVFSGAPTKRPHLTELAVDLTHNRGLITLSSVLPSGARSASQQDALESTIQDYLDKQGIEAFVRLVTAPDPFSGMEKLVDAYGIGPLVPNTVLLGDTEAESTRDRFCQMIATCHQAKRNVLIFRSQPDNYPDFRYRFPTKRRIDVWWGGLQANGGLMLILAYLLRTSGRWRNADVYLNLVVPNEQAKAAAESNLKRIVQSLRIGAIPRVIVARDRAFDDILKASSRTADLVFLGLATPEDNFTEYYLDLQRRTASLPATILVLASEELEFAEVLQRDS
ncbi:MAG: amino acid permease, partial [Cyanobacteria bacterium J06638_6]